MGENKSEVPAGHSPAAENGNQPAPVAGQTAAITKKDLLLTFLVFFLIFACVG